MARRRLTVKRIDPWSVLKFGFIANLALLAIFLMMMGVVWFIVDRLQLVDQVCGIATDVGFTECGINAGNLFRSLILLGLLWVVIQTAVLVFFSFLHNLIADLTGGLGLTIVDDSLPAASSNTRNSRQVSTAGHQPGATRQEGAGDPVAPSSAGQRVGSRQRNPDARVRRDGVGADASTTSRSAAISSSDDELFRGR